MRSSSRIIPSKAMSSDVLPEPVCPIMRFTQPRLKKISSSMRKVKLRRADPGVAVPLLSEFQVKDDARIPMAASSTSGSSRSAGEACSRPSVN